MNSQEQKDLPLVSIVVLTYNSSKYVLETLESAYNQTYEGPLELIITDDCSTDDTVDICKEWLRGKSDRFVRADIVCMPENGGITKNVNQGCRAARGEWIKVIAGDDILMNDCLDKMLVYSFHHPDAVFISGLVRYFVDGEEIKDVNKLHLWNGVSSGVAIDSQYHFRKRYEFPPSPAWILKRSFLKLINYYPNVCRNVEDYPLFLKTLSEGKAVHVMPEATVLYRIRKGSMGTQLNFRQHKEIVLFRYHEFVRKTNIFAKIDLMLEYLVISIQGAGLFFKCARGVIYTMRRLYSNLFISLYRVY